MKNIKHKENSTNQTSILLSECRILIDRIRNTQEKLKSF